MSQHPRALQPVSGRDFRYPDSARMIGKFDAWASRRDPDGSGPPRDLPRIFLGSSPGSPFLKLCLVFGVLALLVFRYARPPFGADPQCVQYSRELCVVRKARLEKG